MNDDIDIEDFDDQGASDDLEAGEEPEQSAPKRGGGLMKLVILLVIIGGGAGAYFKFKDNPLLRHVLAQHGIVLPGQKMAQQHVLPPRHPVAPVVAQVQKTVPPASFGNSIPVAHETPPSPATLSPPPALAVPPAPAAPMATPTAPSPIAMPASPFSIPPQQPAAAPQKSSGNTASLQMPAAPMGMPGFGDENTKNSAPSMPTIPVPAVNKINVAPPQDTHTQTPPVPPATPDMMAAPAPPGEQAPDDQASVQTSPQPDEARDDSAEVQKLKRKIKLLENTIKQLQQAPVVPHHETHETSRHRVVHNHLHVVHHYHHKVRRHSAAKSAWVLKAAQPGVAWVSYRGSKVLHKVQPGNKLRGIGEVEFIVHDSLGRWVVVGTKGRISQ